MDNVTHNKKPKEEKRAVKLMRAGMTAAEASRTVGVHSTTAQRWAHTHGIELLRDRADDIIVLRHPRFLD